MIDWTKSMQQTYEYYIVDPDSWKDTELLTVVKKCDINRDASVETRGSATIDITDLVGECYIRVYLIAIQNGVRHKEALGTFLCQTPASTFDGKKRDVSIDAYTPLIELKENKPPIGYFVPKDDNVMDTAYELTSKHLRAPVVKTSNPTTNFADFVADPAETWLSFLTDFISNHVYTDTESNKPTVTKYTYDLDEMGRVLFAPEQDTASLQPVWIYDDGNSSILYPELDMDHDLYDVPNVVEVSYTKNGTNYYARVVNDNPDSPISTVNRGREILYREIDPDLAGIPNNDILQEYAERLLKDLSSPEYKITYTHGYCPVRLGDCVLLNYNRAGLTNIKAKVVSQSISCEPGCPVVEKAVFNAKLWR